MTPLVAVPSGHIFAEKGLQFVRADGRFGIFALSVEGRAGSFMLALELDFHGRLVYLLDMGEVVSITTQNLGHEFLKQFVPGLRVGLFYKYCLPSHAGFILLVRIERRKVPKCNSGSRVVYGNAAGVSIDYNS